MRYAVPLVLAVGSLPHASDLLVPQQFPSIQSALDAAAQIGDAVLVSPGIYAEQNVDFLGKEVVVRSVGGAAVTTVDAQSLGRVFVFQTGETPGAVLDGFTLRNGRAPDGAAFAPPGVAGDPGGSGGGVLIDGASPTIVNCVIEDCRAGDGGAGGTGPDGTDGASGSGAPGGIGGAGAPGGAGGAGGGLYVATGTPLIANCVLVANRSGDGGPGGKGGNGGDGGSGLNGGNGGPGGFGGIGGGAGHGGGVGIGAAVPTLLNCTVATNALGLPGPGGPGGQGGQGGDGGTFGSDGSSGPPGGPGPTGPPGTGGGVHSASVTALVRNSILFVNAPPQLGGAPTVSFSNAPGPPPGVGNIDANPLFADLGSRDVHIAFESPCRDAGDSSAVLLPATDYEGDPRVSGLAVDMGVDEVVFDFPGTDADLELRTLVNGLGLPTAPFKGATAGDALTVELDSPLGTFVNGLPILALQLVPTGTPIPPDLGLPGVHLNPATPGFVVFYIWKNTPLGPTTLGPGGLSFAFTVPSGLAGHTARFQGLVLHPSASNGLYATSDAHEVELQ